MDEKTNKIIDFVMFVIYRLSESWKRPVSEVYSILVSSGALNNYLIPHYDVLHTLGAEYLAEDLTLYVRNHGGTI